MSPVIPSQVAAIISDPTATLCGNFKNTLLRFPALFYKWFKWAFTAGGSASLALKREIRYTGDLIFSASGLLEDDSRLLCNGQAVVRTDFPELFTAIGTSYGAGNTTTTFNVPDYRDRFPIGVSGTKPIASTGGEKEHILLATELPSHTHGMRTAFQADGGSPNGWLYNQLIGIGGDRGDVRTIEAGSTAGMSAPNVTAGYPITKANGNATGLADAHNNIPPYVACFIYIAT